MGDVPACGEHAGAEDVCAGGAAAGWDSCVGTGAEEPCGHLWRVCVFGWGVCVFCCGDGSGGSVEADGLAAGFWGVEGVLVDTEDVGVGGFTLICGGAVADEM